jgi:GNAT superfamily N-acetyltransferase
MQRVKITDRPLRKDVEFLKERINEHNIVLTGRSDYRPLAALVRDDDRALIAGLYAFTWAGWLEIEFVWVQRDLRGRGLGRRLIEAAEQEARARGCHRVWLDSYTFQAPGFYERLGYEVFGTLDGYPEMEDRVFLTRTL